MSVSGEQTDRASDEPRVSMAGSRTGMASLRTQLALDRTTLAWIRTSLTTGTFGFGMVSFFRSLRAQVATPEAVRVHEGAILFGEVLVSLGIAFLALAGLSHWTCPDSVDRFTKLRRLEQRAAARSRWG